MNVIMNPKIIFTVLGVLNLVHGLMFFFGGEAMYREAAPDITEGTLSLITTEMEITAGFNFWLGIVLIFCCQLQFPAAKNVLIGTGIGMLVIVPVAIKHMSAYEGYPELQPPAFMIIILALLALWPLYAGIKGSSAESD